MSASKHVCIVLVLLSILGASSAWAEESEEVVAARLHDRRAQELFDNGNFAEALQEMEAAQAVMPSTARLYNMAACNEQLGNRQAAIDLYRQFIAAPDAPEGRRQRAQRQLEQLEEEVATSTSGASGAGEQEGTEEETGTGELTEESWSEPSGRQRLSPTAFYAMLGVTAASGIALIATGALALAREGEFETAQTSYNQSCNDTDLNAMNTARDSGETLVVVSNVMLGLTSAAALTTVLLAVFTNWSGGGSASPLRLASGPGLIGLSGSF